MVPSMRSGRRKTIPRLIVPPPPSLNTSVKHSGWSWTHPSCAKRAVLWYRAVACLKARFRSFRSLSLSASSVWENSPSTPPHPIAAKPTNTDIITNCLIGDLLAGANSTRIRFLDRRVLIRICSNDLPAEYGSRWQTRLSLTGIRPVRSVKSRVSGRRCGCPESLRIRRRKAYSLLLGGQHVFRVHVDGDGPARGPLELERCRLRTATISDLLHRHDVEPVVSGRREVLHVLDGAGALPDGAGEATHRDFSRLAVIELGLGAHRLGFEVDLRIGSLGKRGPLLREEMRQEHADSLALLFGRGRLEGELDGLRVALVSGEPELQTVQLRFAIVALVDLERRVEIAGRLSGLMLVGSDRAHFGDRSKDTWAQHSAAAAIDNRRVY